MCGEAFSVCLAAIGINDRVIIQRMSVYGKKELSLIVTLDSVLFSLMFCTSIVTLSCCWFNVVFLLLYMPHVFTTGIGYMILTNRSFSTDVLFMLTASYSLAFLLDILVVILRLVFFFQGGVDVLPELVFGLLGLCFLTLDLTAIFFSDLAKKSAVALEIKTDEQWMANV